MDGQGHLLLQAFGMRCEESESVLEVRDQEVRFSMLVVHPFRLLLELTEGRHTLLPYLGSAIRGIFASSFRRRLCMTQAPTPTCNSRNYSCMGSSTRSVWGACLFSSLLRLMA
jgi:hypothetical protein